MTTTTQIFTIVGILCTPMITIALLVLILAALNLSLGIRTLYVKLLAFIFDYATKIKRDKERSMDSDISSDEYLSTPKLSFEQRIGDNSTKTNSKTSSINKSKQEINHEDGLELFNKVDYEHITSRISSQSDIQFKLGNEFLFSFFLSYQCYIEKIFYV